VDSLYCFVALVKSLPSPIDTVITIWLSANSIFETQVEERVSLRWNG
jgi:hypothetical protein